MSTTLIFLVSICFWLRLADVGKSWISQQRGVPQSELSHYAGLISTLPISVPQTGLIVSPAELLWQHGWWWVIYCIHCPLYLKHLYTFIQLSVIRQFIIKRLSKSHNKKHRRSDIIYFLYRKQFLKLTVQSTH